MALRASALQVWQGFAKPPVPAGSLDLAGFIGMEQPGGHSLTMKCISLLELLVS